MRELFPHFCSQVLAGCGAKRFARTGGDGTPLLLLHGELGFDRFDAAGHDRGARAAYRLALDHPQRVRRLAVLGAAPLDYLHATLASVANTVSATIWIAGARRAVEPVTLSHNPVSSRHLACAV